jgi:hypothetical protein
VIIAMEIGARVNVKSTPIMVIVVVADAIAVAAYDQA